jgi:transcriptional regulator
MTHPYEKVSGSDLVRFAAENPLAWIVPAADPGAAFLMPLLMETDGAGAPVSLLGHLPRQAAVTQALQTAPAAVCLFLGPHSYIPPGWISRPGWAPTWNFVSLKAAGDILPDDSLTDEAVRKLVAQMEAASGWTIDQVGTRYESLLRGVVGFRMRIVSLTPRFKTGQDETETSRAEIHAALEGHTLQSWMR